MLLDLLLPDKNGTDVLAAIRGVRPQTAVVMVTGVSDVPTVVASLRAGAFDYITKPYQVEELLKRVSNAVRQKRLEDDFLMSRLKLSESHYQYLVQNSPDMIYTLDARGHFTFISGAVEVLGYRPGDLIGRHYSTIVHPADRHTAERSFGDRRSEWRGGQVSELRLLPNPGTRPEDPEHTVYTEVKAKGLYGDVARGQPASSRAPTAWRATTRGASVPNGS